MKTPSNVRKSLSAWRTNRTNKSRTADSTPRPCTSNSPHNGNRLNDVHLISASKTKELRQRLSRMFDGGTDVVSTPSVEQNKVRNSEDEIERQSRKSETRKNGHFHHPSSNVSLHSIPPQDLPDRTSSLHTSNPPAIQDFPSWKLAPPTAAGQLIPSRGRNKSPVKRGTLREGVSSDQVRRSSSRTFLRSRPPIHVLEHGTHTSRRLQIYTNLGTSLFVGGSTVEGEVKISVDQHDNGKNCTRPLLISKLSVNVLGFEDINGGRKHVFLALASDLFDKDHPPPQSIVQSQNIITGSQLFWTARAGTASIPFCVNLPLNLGPAPYFSKQARIRYVLLTTLVFQDGMNRDVVTHSRDVEMLTVFDPQKALASLPNPLISSETANLTAIPGPQSVKLTCGLHRQIWVSGSLIFVDIHIINQSARFLRKIDVQIEKAVLWYTHAAAGTAETTANHLRVPQHQDSEVIAMASFKKSKEWQGIGPHSSEVCTRHIQIPRRDITVSMGRFFELPITLIHMNSLDIVPNALAQVAASIEAKRSRTLPLRSDDLVHLPYHQGQAFVASQKLSLKMKQQAPESPTNSGVEGLKRDFDRSPRKFQSHHNHFNHHRGQSDQGCLKNVGKYHHGQNLAHNGGHRHSHESDCYHCHIHHIARDRKSLAAHLQNGLVLPQLQVSTSGLDFTESEFTVLDPPPKKVMLSEYERKMINQQRELQRRSDWADAKQQKPMTKSKSHRRQTRSEKMVGSAPSQPEITSGQNGSRGINRAKTFDRRRSKTLDQPLKPSNVVDIRPPLSTNRKRANTGPTRLNVAIAFAEKSSEPTEPSKFDRERPSIDKQPPRDMASGMRKTQ